MFFVFIFFNEILVPEWSVRLMFDFLQAVMFLLLKENEIELLLRIYLSQLMGVPYGS